MISGCVAAVLNLVHPVDKVGLVADSNFVAPRAAGNFDAPRDKVAVYPWAGTSPDPAVYECFRGTHVRGQVFPVLDSAQTGVAYSAVVGAVRACTGGRSNL
jgi:hypothetical protein